jgi:hypothetical protein
MKIENIDQHGTIFARGLILALGEATPRQVDPFHHLPVMVRELWG